MAAWGIWSVSGGHVPKVVDKLEQALRREGAVSVPVNAAVAPSSAARAGTAPARAPAPSAVAPMETANTSSAADQLRQLKQLLDIGAITQTEYDDKKAEALKRL